MRYCVARIYGGVGGGGGGGDTCAGGSRGGALHLAAGTGYRLTGLSGFGARFPVAGRLRQMAPPPASTDCSGPRAATGYTGGAPRREPRVSYVYITTTPVEVTSGSPPPGSGVGARAHPRTIYNAYTLHTRATGGIVFGGVRWRRRKCDGGGEGGREDDFKKKVCRYSVHSEENPREPWNTPIFVL